MNYIKSLFPYRWLAIAALIVMVEIIIFGLPENFIYFATIINIFTWFYVDFTIGIGRREESVIFNIIGILYLLFLSGFIIFVANNLI